MTDPDHQITLLLGEISAGRSAVSDELLPLVYQELRHLAHARMGREGPQTLQPTALVHEAFLRLVGEDVSWEGRGHFFAAAAEAMRRILIERARRVARVKHGGEQQFVELKEDRMQGAAQDVDLLSLDEALTRLEQHDERMAQVVKLRYFAGMTLEETGQMLELTPRTVSRDWMAAKTWLYRELSRDSL